MEGGVKQAAKMGILTFIPVPQVRLLWDVFSNSPATIFLISDQIIDLIRIHYKKDIENNIKLELDKIYKKKKKINFFIILINVKIKFLFICYFIYINNFCIL